MMAEDSSEEASHFESMLGRLDALIKRNQENAEPPPALEPLPQHRDIPVLTEVYPGAAYSAPFDQNQSLPDLQPGTDGNSQQTSTFSALPAHQSESLSQAVIAPEHDPNTPTDSAPDLDKIAEKLLASLLPTLQSRIDELLCSEHEAALERMRSSIRKSIQEEFKQAMERELRVALKQSATNSTSL